MEGLSGLSGCIVGLDTAPLIYYIEENKDCLSLRSEPRMRVKLPLQFARNNLILDQ